MPLKDKGTQKRPGIRRQDTSSTGGRSLIILVIVSMLLLVLGTRERPAKVLSTTRDIFQTITLPVRFAGSLVTAPFNAAGNVIMNLTTDQGTLSELREENQRLRARNAELEEAAISTERLENLLELKNTYSLSSTGARIISKSSDSWSATVILDKGTTSGLSVGMPVTDSAGVIGQIIECGPATSVVRLIVDENSGVSAMVQRSRAQGMLKGSATGTIKLTLIRPDQSVEVGDTVVTSGLGGVFPKGLPLGKVTSVEKASGSLYYDVVVEPLASPESLEEVLVITSVSTSQQATAEDIAEADAQETSSLKKDDAMTPLEVDKDEDSDTEGEVEE